MKLIGRLKTLLRYAALAPSGYNSQPWKFRLGDDFIEIIPDYTRARLKTDPEYREFFMSLGAVAFNLEVAAKHFGLTYQKTYSLDDPQRQYSIFFKFSGQKAPIVNSPLFSAISTRHTNRFAYQDLKLSKTLINKLRSLPHADSVDFHLVTRPGDINAFAKLIDRSFLLWSRQKSLVEELENWLRDDLKFSPDGLPTGVINLYKLAINLKYFLHPKDPQVNSAALKSQELAKNAPALAVISTKKDTVSDWFQAGEFFELLTLTLSSLGFTTDFFNYPLTLKKPRIVTGAMLNTKNLPQLLFRIGKPTIFPPRTFRRPLKELIIK